MELKEVVNMDEVAKYHRANKDFFENYKSSGRITYYNITESEKEALKDPVLFTPVNFKAFLPENRNDKDQPE